MSIRFLSLSGLVLIPLLGFSMCAIALIIERLFFWWRIQRQQTRVIQEFLARYPDNPQGAIPLLEKHENLPLARIFLAALELNHPTPEEFRLALESAAQAEMPLLKRFNTVFETIIAVAPLLGLLGTILGLIESFAALKIGDVGGTNSAGVSAGISDALVTTAVGLIVAIATLLFANLFRGLYRRQLALIQRYGGQLELFYRNSSFLRDRFSAD
ncbi:MotA/TolQ/ExbB proton channel family protein [Lusitaniella coriacea LEGE 07157]|uniref:MotA/TolQ/ExbB proton channel family protein n=1 Tax=Lusitaniella coriacea LEGE 07157 TaxID=945747 RepID=A0A8J7DWE9_9CYAN|nr:MotA/TolQ/ExbB proton channel family protein [Lusitaniella coriacea]MBE9116043.1 MotA/TolQ/ExbB proton channel family protein [Lusitaniella coriacea LEGE 07157]